MPVVVAIALISLFKSHETITIRSLKPIVAVSSTHQDHALVPIPQTARSITTEVSGENTQLIGANERTARVADVTHKSMDNSNVTVRSRSTVNQTDQSVVDSVIIPSDSTITSTLNSTTPRVAFMTFAHLLDFSRFERLIFPALDTFLAKTTTTVNDVYYHVVLQNEWKEKFYNDLCRFNATYAAYCQRIKPLFVDCPEGHFGESPCCKQEKGLLALLDDKEEGVYDFYAYYDDDTYFRVQHLMEFLNQVDPTTIMIITGGRPGTSIPLGEAGYMKLRKRAYNCSVSNTNYTYPWGQPVLYTRASLEHVAAGLGAGGLVKQCQEFHVTHDAGNAIFHWMYSLPELRLPFLRSPPLGRYDPSFFGTHGVENTSVEPAVGGRRRRRKIINPSMREIHANFSTTGFKLTDRQWHNVSGFLQTECYKEHGHPWTWGKDEWHTMRKTDCMAPLDKISED